MPILDAPDDQAVLQGDVPAAHGKNSDSLGLGPLGDVPGVFCCVVLIDDRPIDRTLLDPAGHPVKRGSVLPDDPRRPKWRTPGAR